MYFAFIDSPIQLMVLLVVLLILFGPQKLPEIGQQLGRAIRDLKKATSEFQSSMHLDDLYDSSYHPPRYDSYGNLHESGVSASVAEEHTWHPDTPETKAVAALSEADPPKGDFAAAALADASVDYGVGLSPGASETETGHGPSYPEGTVPRTR